jgi:hypothetical protein
VFSEAAREDGHFTVTASKPGFESAKQVVVL